MNFQAALRKELMEQLRTYRLLMVGAVLIVFGLLSPLLAKITPEIIKMIPEGEFIAQLIPPPTIMDAVAQYIKNTGQFSILLALLVTMGSVVQEKEKGTAAMMLVKPLPRLTFLIAKFTALALMFVVTIAIAGLACYYYTWLLFGALDLPGWIALNGLLLVFVLVYVALTLFCSVVTKSQAGAGALALGMLFIISLIGSIPGLGEHLPGQLLIWGGGMMAGETETFWPALWVSLGIIVVALAMAGLIFQKQEL